MRVLNALSLTSHVNDWLTNTHHPHILHVFDHACNLINEHKDVLSIVTPQVGNGPFNLVVEDDVLFSKYLKSESSVSTFDDQLKIGGLTFDMGKVQLWNPRPDWERLHASRESILNQLTSLPYADYQPTLPVSLLATLTMSITHADINASLTATKHLAGLGMGLTPSGDDFIMGALHAAWIIHPLGVASALAKKTAETAAPLTTSLSAAWLWSASRGEAGILWHEFFDALIAKSDLQLPITKLLSVGETSGADALAGFRRVISAFKERIIDECPS